MTDGLALLGRILLSAIFVQGGVSKLMAMGATVGYFTHVGLPVPEAAWAVAVFCELVCGAALLVGLLTRPAALVLAVWCIATALVAHADFGDRMQAINFMKNLGLAGGMLYAAAFGAGRFSLDAMRTRRVVAMA